MAVKQIEKMNLGPTLTKSVEQIVALAKEEFGDDFNPSAVVPGDDFSCWLIEEAVPQFVPGDQRGIKKLLKEAPGLLGYCVDLEKLYPVTAVTPGWLFGEACYRAVADEVRRQLGVASGSLRHPLK